MWLDCVKAIRAEASDPNDAGSGEAVVAVLGLAHVEGVRRALAEPSPFLCSSKPLGPRLLSAAQVGRPCRVTTRNSRQFRHE